jgi:hypothetical protein
MGTSSYKQGGSRAIREGTNVGAGRCCAEWPYDDGGAIATFAAEPRTLTKHRLYWVAVFCEKTD